MANVGTAYINVVPKFPGFSAAVKGELAAASSGAGTAGTAMGTSMGTGLKSGLAKAGAIAGVVSSLASSALGAVTSQVGAAVSRFDTLNQFPRVMQSLGYAADDADASIEKMSDRLQGLPTKLDTMASTVQGLTAITGDLSKATDIGLALNDMLIAGGASTQMTNSALEQFRQMLSKGKPEMQDWRTLVQAMPGQMDQLAKSMLGPTANANDLYEAVGGGGNEATISLQELCDEIVRLDTEGGDGFASFAEQAQTGAQGVATSMENVKTAIGRGLAGLMEEFGEERFTGLFNGLKVGVDEAFTFLRENVVADLVPVADQMAAAFDKVAPGLKDALAGVVTSAKDLAIEAWGAFEPILPSVSGVVEGIMGVISSAMDGIAPYMDTIAGIVGNVCDVVSGLLSAIEPIAGEVAVAFAAFSVFKGVAQLVSPATTAVGGIVSALSGGAGAASTFGGAIATALGASSPAAVAVAGIVTLVGLVVSGLMDADERSRDLAASMSSSDSVVAGLQGMRGYKTQVDDLKTSADDAALSLENLAKVNAGRSEQVSGILSDTKSELDEVSEAWAIIQQYAGQTSLSAEAAGQVQWAAQKISEATGIQLEASDVAAGVYKDEEGAAHDLIGTLQELVQQKLLTTELEGINQAMDVQRQKVTDATATMQKWQNVYDSKYVEAYNDALKKNCDETEAARTATIQATSAADAQVGSYESVYGAVLDANRGMNELEKQAGKLSGTIDGTADAWTQLAVKMEHDNAFATANGYLQGNGYYMEDLIGTMKDYGVSVEDVSNLSASQLEALAMNYHGNIEDIIGLLNTFGIEVDEAAQNQTVAVRAMKQTLEELGDSATTAFEETGVSTRDFAEALQEAGVSTEQVNAIGSENLAQLAYACQGNVGLMVAAIANYNGTPILDKEGNVNADVSGLVDAQGNVYTWNGTQLLDKDNQVVVDDAELVDAYGNVVTWNGTELKSKSGSANVSTNIPSVLGYITEYNNRVIKDKYGTVTITTKNVQVGSASTGVTAVQKADGGIRMHADGFIANKATWLGTRDIVGEAGSEAIVPLTNRQYAMPFVKMIADEVNRQGAKPQTVNYNLSLDNLKVNDDARIRALSKALVEELVRKGAM